MEHVDMTKNLMWLAALVWVIMAAGHALADKNEILTITVADPISPAVAEFVTDALKRASDTNAA